MQKQAAIVIYIGVLVACIVHVQRYYPLLPEMVPSNFDFDGNVRGYMSKTSMAQLYLGMVALMTLSFPVLGVALKKIPNNLISLPERDYWLTGERRQATLEYLFVAMTWMGTATLLFLMTIFHTCFMAALENATPNVGIIAGLYGGYLVIHSIAIVMKFSKKPDGTQRT